MVSYSHVLKRGPYVSVLVATSNFFGCLAKETTMAMVFKDASQANRTLQNLNDLQCQKPGGTLVELDVEHSKR